MYDEADPLFVRSIAIGEKVLGPEHPDLSLRVHNRAILLRKQVTGGGTPRTLHRVHLFSLGLDYSTVELTVWIEPLSEDSP